MSNDVLNILFSLVIPLDYKKMGKCQTIKNKFSLPHENIATELISIRQKAHFIIR